MEKIPVNALIADFRRMLTDRWGYIPGTAGQRWTQADQDASTNEAVKKYGQQWVGHQVADCSGAFVAAYRQHGLTLYHGSNHIARMAVARLLPVSEGGPGMAAFRLRRPREAGYDLPAAYRPGGPNYNGDENDYYHIGLVDADGCTVLNAQNPKNGFGASPLSGWDAAAQLLDVAYDKEEFPVTEKKMAVFAQNGKPVNLRSSPGKDAPILAQVPVGTLVTMLSQDGEWACVRYGARQGYMMAEFLREPEENDPLRGQIDDIRRLLEDVSSKIEEAQRLLAALDAEGDARDS